jgi:hypothetical protein
MPGLGLVSSAFGLGCVALPLGGDWPGLWTDGPTIFGAPPNTRGRWLRCLLLSLGPLRSAARWSLFPYVYADTAYHRLEWLVRVLSQDVTWILNLSMLGHKTPLVEWVWGGM